MKILETDVKGKLVKYWVLKELAANCHFIFGFKLRHDKTRSAQSITMVSVAINKKNTIETAEEFLNSELTGDDKKNVQYTKLQIEPWNVVRKQLAKVEAEAADLLCKFG